MKLADQDGLVMESRVVRILGITPIRLEQVKTKLNIHTIKVPRVLAGKRSFDYKKIRLKHAFEIIDWLERERGV